MTGDLILLDYQILDYLLSVIYLENICANFLILNCFFFLVWSVFDIDDDSIPVHFRNGYTFFTADEQVYNCVAKYYFEI